MSEKLSRDQDFAAAIAGAKNLLKSASNLLKDGANYVTDSWSFKPFQIGRQSWQLLPPQIKPLSETESFPDVFASFFVREVPTESTHQKGATKYPAQSFTQLLYLAVDFAPRFDRPDRAVIAAGVWIYASDQMKSEEDWPRDSWWNKLAQLHRRSNGAPQIGVLTRHHPISWPEDSRCGDVYGALSICHGVTEITCMKEFCNILVEPLLQSAELNEMVSIAFGRSGQILDIHKRLDARLRAELNPTNGKKVETLSDPAETACPHTGFGFTLYPWGRDRLGFRIETESSDGRWRLAGGLFSKKSLRCGKKELDTLRSLYGGEVEGVRGDDDDKKWVGWKFLDDGGHPDVFSLLDWASDPKNEETLASGIISEIRRVQKKAKPFKPHG